MGRLLRFAAPGVAGVGLCVAAYSVFWLWADASRNRLEKPTPIPVGRWVEHRKVIPIYDGSVWTDR